MLLNLKFQSVHVKCWNVRDFVGILGIEIEGWSLDL